MKYIDLNMISQLKSILEKEIPGLKLHVHDTCGGQFFELEGSFDDINYGFELIWDYFNERKIKIETDTTLNTFRAV